MPNKSAVLPPQVILSQSTLYASQGNIYALEASSGAIRQSYPIQGLAFPTIGNDTTLYLNVCRHPDYQIKALRGDDGTLLWSYKVEEGRLTGAPVIAEEIVYSIIEKAIYALQAQDGIFLWRATLDTDPEVPAFLGPIIFAPPTIWNGIAYLVPGVNSPEQPFLYAFQAKNGTLLWKKQIARTTFFPLTILDGVIYLSTHLGCAALRASDGSAIWQDETEMMTRSLAVVANGMVYNSAVKYYHVLAGYGRMEQQSQGFLYARRASDGATIWKQQVGNATSEGYMTTPVVIEDAIYTGANDGQLYAFQARDGVPLWHSQIKDISLSSPTGANGVVYVGGDDGCVYAFRASDGTLLWKTFVSTAITGASSITMEDATLTDFQ